MQFDETITIEESFFYQSIEMEKILKEINSLPINLNDEISDIFHEVFNFSIDDNKRIRLSTGMIAFDENSDNNMSYVPRISYGPTDSSFSHQNFILTLPNPTTQGISKFQETRSLCLEEIKKRMDRAFVKANELIQQETEDLAPATTKKHKPR